VGGALTAAGVANLVLAGFTKANVLKEGDQNAVFALNLGQGIGFTAVGVPLVVRLWIGSRLSQPGHDVARRARVDFGSA
jgi:hypothetical protein